MTAFERRRYARTHAYFFTVFNRQESEGQPPLPHIGYTRDISTGGMYFYTRSEAAVGDGISVTIHLPSDWGAQSSPPNLEGAGKVLRVDTNRKVLPLGYINGVAVEFAEELDFTF